MERGVKDEVVVAPTNADDAASIEMGNVFEAEYANEQHLGSSKQLHRTFSARHIQMIGLAGSIGSGLFIGTGKVSSESLSSSSRSYTHVPARLFVTAAILACSWGGDSSVLKHG